MQLRTTFQGLETRFYGKLKKVVGKNQLEMKDGTKPVRCKTFLEPHQHSEVTPCGNFRYKRLPMGASQVPGLFQEIMEPILKDLPDVKIFFDDIGRFSQDYLSPMKTIATVLHRLQANEFTVNPLKSEWAVKETDWLGYWLRLQIIISHL